MNLQTWKTILLLMFATNSLQLKISLSSIGTIDLGSVKPPPAPGVVPPKHLATPAPPEKTKEDEQVIAIKEEEIPNLYSAEYCKSSLFNHEKLEFYPFECSKVGQKCMEAILSKWTHPFDPQLNFNTQKLPEDPVILQFKSRCKAEDLGKGALNAVMAPIYYFPSEKDFIQFIGPNGENCKHFETLYALGKVHLEHMTRDCFNNMKPEKSFYKVSFTQFKQLSNEVMSEFTIDHSKSFTWLRAFVQEGCLCSKLPGLSVLTDEQLSFVSPKCISQINHSKSLQQMKESQISFLSLSALASLDQKHMESVAFEEWKMLMKTGEICRGIKFASLTEQQRRAISDKCLFKAISFNIKGMEDGMEAAKIQQINPEAFKSLLVADCYKMSDEYWKNISDLQFEQLLEENKENCVVVMTKNKILSSKRIESIEPICTTEVRRKGSELLRLAKSKGTNLKINVIFTISISLIVAFLVK